VRIPAGGTAIVRLDGPGRALTERFHLELNEPPEGITIKSVSPSRNGTEMLLQCDASKVKPGLAGNLIVETFAARADAPGKAKGKGNPRRAPLGVLPAIPFEIISAR